MKKQLSRADVVRAVPWIISTVAVIAFGASFSELQRMRGRFGEVTRYQDANREWVIRAEIVRAESPIIVIGDSITERAKFPPKVGGHPVINAGISGSTIEDFDALTPMLFRGTNPWLVAVALGANNAKTAGARLNYAPLLSKLKKLTPRVLAIAVTPLDGSDQLNAEIKAAAAGEGVPFVEMPIPEEGRKPDGIHLSAAGYQTWTPAVVSAISQPNS